MDYKETIKLNKKKMKIKMNIFVEQLIQMGFYKESKDVFIKLIKDVLIVKIDFDLGASTNILDRYVPINYVLIVPYVQDDYYWGVDIDVAWLDEEQIEQRNGYYLIDDEDVETEPLRIAKVIKEQIIEKDEKLRRDEIQPYCDKFPYFESEFGVTYNTIMNYLFLNEDEKAITLLKEFEKTYEQGIEKELDKYREGLTEEDIKEQKESLYSNYDLNFS